MFAQGMPFAVWACGKLRPCDKDRGAFVRCAACLQRNGGLRHHVLYEQSKRTEYQELKGHEKDTLGIIFFCPNEPNDCKQAFVREEQGMAWKNGIGMDLIPSVSPAVSESFRLCWEQRLEYRGSVSDVFYGY